tara:strand:+ start:8173 stop:8589 length:417 start_codon:yes stop_codon:yes gene_type:complete
MVLGGPTILAGQGLKGTGRGLVKAGEVTMAAGVVTEAKGLEIKGSYASKAASQAKVDAEVSKGRESERHAARLEQLEVDLRTEHLRHAMRMTDLVEGDAPGTVWDAVYGDPVTDVPVEVVAKEETPTVPAATPGVAPA